jgi:hypothetical protein
MYLKSKYASKSSILVAWLSFGDALAVADAICEAAKKSGAQ